MPISVVSESSPPPTSPPEIRTAAPAPARGAHATDTADVAMATVRGAEALYQTKIGAIARDALLNTPKTVGYTHALLEIVGNSPDLAPSEKEALAKYLRKQTGLESDNAAANPPSATEVNKLIGPEARSKMMSVFYDTWSNANIGRVNDAAGRDQLIKAINPGFYSNTQNGTLDSYSRIDMRQMEQMIYGVLTASYPDPTRRITIQERVDFAQALINNNPESFKLKYKKEIPPQLIKTVTYLRGLANTPDAQRSFSFKPEVIAHLIMQINEDTQFMSPEGQKGLDVSHPYYGAPSKPGERLSVKLMPVGGYTYLNTNPQVTAQSQLMAQLQTSMPVADGRPETLEARRATIINSFAALGFAGHQLDKDQLSWLNSQNGPKLLNEYEFRLAVLSARLGEQYKNGSAVKQYLDDVAILERSPNMSLKKTGLEKKYSHKKSDHYRPDWDEYLTAVQKDAKNLHAATAEAQNATQTVKEESRASVLERMRRSAAGFSKIISFGDSN